MAAGTVTASGLISGYGNHVVITHGEGWTSLYGHMASASPLLVGQSVGAGSYIGPVGMTGNSTGPHLHLQLELNGVPQDPASLIRVDALAPNPPRYPNQPKEEEEDMDKLYIITQGTTSRWAPGSKFLISNGRSRLVSTADLALVGLALSDGIEVTTSEMGRVLALHSIPDSGSVSINDFDRYRNISLALNADSATPNIQYTVSSNLEAVKSGVGAIRTKVGA